MNSVWTQWNNSNFNYESEFFDFVLSFDSAIAELLSLDSDSGDFHCSPDLGFGVGDNSSLTWAPNKVWENHHTIENMSSLWTNNETTQVLILIVLLSLSNLFKSHLTLILLPGDWRWWQLSTDLSSKRYGETNPQKNMGNEIATIAQKRIAVIAGLIRGIELICWHYVTCWHYVPSVGQGSNDDTWPMHSFQPDSRSIFQNHIQNHIQDQIKTQNLLHSHSLSFQDWVLGGTVNETE